MQHQNTFSLYTCIARLYSAEYNHKYEGGGVEEGGEEAESFIRGVQAGGRVTWQLVGGRILMGIFRYVIRTCSDC